MLSRSGISDWKKKDDTISTNYENMEDILLRIEDLKLRWQQEREAEEQKKPEVEERRRDGEEQHQPKNEALEKRCQEDQEMLMIFSNNTELPKKCLQKQF